ncbi:MAG TPA: enoyl-CoA hydratase/isomerase family protein [Thermoanaerobaculia bacterium]|nr:enoyl-CoA hydratase/isomerase family protein [Thermoanaerobaculia bacterium]
MLEITAHGPIREIRFNRPPVNALSPELVAALRGELAGAVRDGVEALVLSGPPRRFSGGLDVPLLLSFDRPAILAMWREFYGLMRDLAACPIPIAAAITGHAPAGGAVLSMFCDRRFMAEGDEKGPYLIGLNEVRVGLSMPPVIARTCARVVGERHAARMCMEGALMPAAEAHAIGFVDRLVPGEAVVEEALAWCRGVLALPRQAMLATRRLFRAPIVALLDEDTGEIETMADVWFSAETQGAMRAMVEGLKRKG